MAETRDARISDLLDELDALAAQLEPAEGGETVSKLSDDVARARKELASLEEGEASLSLARLFDVAHQRIASVLQDHRMPAEDRKALEASAADLQEWRKELLQESANTPGAPSEPAGGG